MAASNSFDVLSYNITADFFSDKSVNHNWQKERKQAVFQLLENYSPNVMCIQELSTQQCCDFVEKFEQKYDCFFLAQTPSELPLGMIAKNEQVFDWKGKNSGTAIIAILVKKATMSIISMNRFWLNPTLDITTLQSDQIYKDRAQTDKGFGNMNTYRAVLYGEFKHEKSGQQVFVFNSHYPLSGENETRLKCAQHEREQIDKLTENGKHLWVACGDRNFIIGQDVQGDEENCLKAQMALKKDAFVFHEADLFYGMKNNTWIGFDYDDFSIYKKGKEGVLDYCVSSQKPTIAMYDHGLYQFDDGKFTFLPMDTKLDPKLKSASDHALVYGRFNV